MPAELTAKDLLKTQGIITCDPSSTLAQALAKLQSSHDAIFVVGEKNKLLGVISPYYVIYKSSYPAATKVENCMFSPPKLKLTTPISEIARHMILSKVYYLPVFSDNGSWLGIVSARTLLGKVASDTQLRTKLNFKRKTKSIISIKQNAFLSETRELLRSKKVSWLPVVSEGGKLVGILTRYDLRLALATPKTSQSFLSRSGEKKKFQNQPIRNFFKRSVETATLHTPVWQMLNTMLERNIGSIVIVSPKWQPIGILTFKDVLQAIAGIGAKEEKVLDILFPDDFEEKEPCSQLIHRLQQKISQKTKLKYLQVIVETQKNPAHKINQFKLKAKAIRESGKPVFAQALNFNWKIATRQVLKKIENQLST